MINTDYIIVGQGLAGTLLSYHMFQHGMDHRVISDTTLPSSSLVSAGMYNPLVFKRITKSWMIDDLLPYMNQVYNEMEQLFGEKFLFPKTIAKLVKDTDLSLWKERIGSQDLHRYIETIEKDYFHDIIPEPHYVALIRESGYIKTQVLLNAYQQFLQSNQWMINEAFDFEQLDVHSASIQYKDIRANTIIFCEGALAVQNPLFGKRIPFYLTRGDLLVLKIADFQQDYIFNKDFFLLPVDGKYILGSTYKRIAEPDYTDHPAEKELLLSRFQKAIDRPYEIHSHTVGVRPTMKDRRPVLGRHPTYPNLHVFNGLGTKGVMLAPYFAREMVNKLLDPNYELLPEVDFARFV